MRFTAVLLALACASHVHAAGIQMRQAFFNVLEARSHGEPGRYVELLVRFRTPHADGPMLSTEALPETLEERAQAVDHRAGALMSALASIPGELESALAPHLMAKSEVLDNLWAARCVHMRVPADQVAALLANPGVDGVFENVMLHAIPRGEHGAEAQGIQAASGSATGAFESWGQTKIRTLQAQQAFNVDGTGVVIGHIDTGVDDTHPALAGKVIRFRDFVNGQTRPYDDDGHGTHTAGTMAGRNGIGVAPGARLIVAKSLDRNGNGSLVNLLRAMQWMLDPDGNPATNDRPHLVSNSWGVRPGEAHLDGQEDTLFWETIRAWRTAGIIPVFSAGNSGTGRMLLPGSYPVNFAVGATDPSDNVANFSSSGQVNWQGWAFFKPDLSAPGTNIPSSLPGNRIGLISGTSMAAPHVAGLLALTIQLNPKISMRDREKILMDACVDIGSPGRSQRSGEGRIDARKTLELIKAYTPPAVAPTDFAPVYMRARRFKVQ